ncbi:hypothetical protein ASPVEDRAFT_34698 [Aspergillus versicolor CBS 583.65]|uniref:Xylanolytic transcriptional activator regulatory domain-containing protein n=1 Tax=Aspergillus versicolor CBS 583.65 TaxID=1036611 RepID=A0A1L9Q452_ASPVE|nr:uncharacterized protein ASPVEDRAFT_34698 [Aspergillus versicolor CBS 583.65]OJJ08555.1 hypothetical protein ASPVEDRAFT_34698 [Aspergillus versicolor CBS 583.65]
MSRHEIYKCWSDSGKSRRIAAYQNYAQERVERGITFLMDLESSHRMAWMELSASLNIKPFLMAPSSLSGECGFCRSNNICCNEDKPGCLTCRAWGIKCPLIERYRDSSGDELTVGNYDGDSPPFSERSTAVHYMQPLDNLISAAHDLLGTSTSYTLPSTLPQYIKKPDHDISLEDVQYLDENGVFTFPDEELRNELLTTFVINVYPYMPLLDLEEFLQAIAINNGSSPLSLLLFHAVMFASATFIKPHHLYRAGYSSQKEPRREFFLKATIAYDLGLETDPIVIIQSALLLTYWHETPDSPRDFHYWLETAFSLATSIGLPDLAEAEPSRELNRLGRRLWWCLYTRDRLNAMNLRRNTIIPEESYTTTLPTLDDFTIGVFPAAITRMLDSCDVLRSPYHQAQLAAIFIEKARLSTIISRIITPDPDAATISRCTDLLQAWRADLPYYIEHESLPPTSTLSDIEKPIFTYRAWLNLVFLNALSAVYKHKGDRCGSHPTEAFSSETTRQDTSDRQIQPAIQSIAAIVEELYRVDVIHYLGTTTVGLLLPVLATQMFYIRSGQGPDTWIAGFQSFYDCMKVLRKLGEVYFLAESMAAFFESAVCGDQFDTPEYFDGDGGLKTAPPPLLEEVLTSTELECFLRVIGEKCEK